MIEFEQSVELLTSTDKIEQVAYDNLKRYLPPNFPKEDMNFVELLNSVSVDNTQLFRILQHTQITLSIKSSKIICETFKDFDFNVSECAMDQVRYGEEIHVVKPINVPNEEECTNQHAASIRELWLHSVIYAEDHFNRLLALDIDINNAKSVLPLCIRTEIIVTGSVKNWLDYFLEVEENTNDIRELNDIIIETLSEICPNLMNSVYTDREERI